MQACAPSASSCSNSVTGAKASLSRLYSRKIIRMNSNSTNALTFSSGLQTEFAELSGDWNPMHMSSVAARRTQAGSAVVHGIHVVLSLLDSFAPSSLDLALPSKLAARFLKPVYVQDTVTILRKNGASNELQLQAL